MTIEQLVTRHYLAADRALCLRLFKEGGVYRTLQDAHDAMERVAPPGLVESEMQRARSMVASGNFWLSRGCMSAEDLADLQFYEQLVKLMQEAA